MAKPASKNTTDGQPQEKASGSDVATTKKPAKKAQARLLVEVHHEGGTLPINRVVEGDTSFIAALVESGQADDHQDAVDYALTLNEEIISI